MVRYIPHLPYLSKTVLPEDFFQLRNGVALGLSRPRTDQRSLQHIHFVGIREPVRGVAQPLVQNVTPPELRSTAMALTAV